MTHPFITHNGGPCPVSPETMVDVEFRDGQIINDLYAGFWQSRWRSSPQDSWQWEGEPDDNIIAYRLHHPDKGEAS